MATTHAAYRCQRNRKVMKKNKVPKELAESRAKAKFIQEGAKKPKKFYQDVGLVDDPNKVIGLKKKKRAKNSKFVQELEEKANKPIKPKFKFGKEMCKDLDYYIRKYGDDYEAMARDKRNIYQDSKGKLRYKIIKYNKIHKTTESK